MFFHQAVTIYTVPLTRDPVAQCLSAAQRTVQSDFTIHSMHCYFILAGNSEIPIIYHVERVRDGKSFVTRTVQARQRGRVIFTTTMSFVKEGTGGKQLVEHAEKMRNVAPPGDEAELTLRGGEDGPFVSQRIDILNSKEPVRNVRLLGKGS